MKCKQLKPMLLSALAAFVALGFQSCTDDLLEGQPSWLGNSIYERLQEEGNYKTTLRLIDDMGLHDVMSQTGSKTIFAANDEAYKEWFRTNTWGVRSYEDLSQAQKTMLVNTQMLNNAYLVELLGNSQSKGSKDKPETGMVMRRETASSIYDTIYTVRTEDMPQTEAWSYYRTIPGGIHMLKNNKTAPVVMFLPAFMKKNKITDTDLSIITNGQATSTDDAFVNGQKITERDITCKNGYIHKVAGVVAPLDNMAQMVHNNPNTSQWAQLIDRFSAPFKLPESATKEYNRIYNTQDSLYNFGYFDDVEHKYDNMDETKTAKARLAFDPGDNQYMYKNTMNRNFTYDAGAMLVPTNEAFQEWLSTGGKSLIEEYGCLDSIPDLTISKLIKVNMLDNFTDKVPSKFKNVTNDAKNELGVKPEDVVECNLGCNGVVYVVNRLLGPAEYSSVTFPALVREKSLYSLLYRALDDLEYSPYLHSMDTEYTLFMPNDNALLWYVDPINAGENQQSLLQFRMDKQANKIKVSRWEAIIDQDGNITPGKQIQAEAVFTNDAVWQNRFRDMLEGLIVVGDVSNGHRYYKTKGGSILRVQTSGDKATVQGGWQLEHNKKLEATNVFSKPKAQGGNGWSYDVGDGIPQSATRSVYSILRSTPEYSKFFELMNGGDPDTTSTNMFLAVMDKKYKCANPSDNFNVALFDNFNYTVYVPTNESIEAMQSSGALPTWEEFEEQRELAANATSEDEAEKARHNCVVIKNRIFDFIRYHIQDHSIAIGLDPTSEPSGDYESMMVNPETKRYYAINVNYDDNQMTLTGKAPGNVAHVITSKGDGLYNNICKEYWFNGNGNARSIYQSNDAVVHLIDTPLLYSADQLKPWKAPKNKRINRRK